MTGWQDRMMEWRLEEAVYSVLKQRRKLGHRYTDGAEKRIIAATLSRFPTVTDWPTVYQFAAYRMGVEEKLAARSLPPVHGAPQAGNVG